VELFYIHNEHTLKLKHIEVALDKLRIQIKDG
jgi:hypothetical protein